MGKLIVIKFDRYRRADELLKELRKMQNSHLLDLEDACAVRKAENGKLRLRQALNLAAMGIATGSWWGALFGLLLGGALPAVAGMSLGAIIGGYSSRWADYGIPDELIYTLSDKLAPLNSAIFILLKNTEKEQLMEHLKGFGGSILHTSGDNQEAEDLQKALAGHRQAA